MAQPRAAYIFLKYLPTSSLGELFLGPNVLSGFSVEDCAHEPRNRGA